METLFMNRVKTCNLWFRWCTCYIRKVESNSRTADSQNHI